MIKQRLIEILPDVKVFLDVDDMKEGRGREYVELSACVCVFISAGYFISKNCMREFLRAVCLGTPIIALVESDVKKGGLSPSEVRQHLHEAEGMYDAWGLTAEFESWNWRQPSAQELHDMLLLDWESSPEAERHLRQSVDVERTPAGRRRCNIILPCRRTSGEPDAARGSGASLASEASEASLFERTNWLPQMLRFFGATPSSRSFSRRSGVRPPPSPQGGLRKVRPYMGPILWAPEPRTHDARRPQCTPSPAHRRSRGCLRCVLAGGSGCPSSRT